MKKEYPEFLNEYLSYKATIQNKSMKTVREYGYDLDHFLKFIVYRFNGSSIPKDDLDNNLSEEHNIKKINIEKLDKKILKKIELKDLHAFLGYLKSKYNSSPHTLARKVSSIRAFFTYICNIDGYLTDNPSLNLETPKLPKKLPKYLDLNESKNLLDSVKNVSNKRSEKYIERNYAIITLFLNCGLRLSELISINISDINFNESKLKVFGKGSKERLLHLNNACTKALIDYLETRPKDISKKHEDALFLSNQKKRISRRTVQYIVENELKKSGLDSSKYSAHKLRHTAATLMYQYGDVDINALAKVLGHESIATTEIYTHAESYEVKRALENNPLSNL